MICEHRDIDYCEKASRMCGIPVLTTDKTCEYCTAQQRPRDKNIVTCGIAYLAIKKAGRQLSEFAEIEQEINSTLQTRSVADNHGPALWRELFLSIETEEQLLNWENRIPKYQCGGKCKKFYDEWKRLHLPEFPLTFRWKWELKNAVNAKLGQKILSYEDAFTFWSNERGV